MMITDISDVNCGIFADISDTNPINHGGFGGCFYDTVDGKTGRRRASPWRVETPMNNGINR